MKLVKLDYSCESYFKIILFLLTTVIINFVFILINIIFFHTIMIVIIITIRNILFIYFYTFIL